jgi:hypothetical protein
MIRESLAAFGSNRWKKSSMQHAVDRNGGKGFRGNDDVKGFSRYAAREARP